MYLYQDPVMGWASRVAWWAAKKQGASGWAHMQGWALCQLTIALNIRCTLVNPSFPGIIAGSAIIGVHNVHMNAIWLWASASIWLTIDNRGTNTSHGSYESLFIYTSSNHSIWKNIHTNVYKVQLQSWGSSQVTWERASCTYSLGTIYMFWISMLCCHTQVLN